MNLLTYSFWGTLKKRKTDFEKVSHPWHWLKNQQATSYQWPPSFPLWIGGKPCFPLSTITEWTGVWFRGQSIKSSGRTREKQTWRDQQAATHGAQAKFHGSALVSMCALVWSTAVITFSSLLHLYSCRLHRYQANMRLWWLPWDEQINSKWKGRVTWDSEGTFLKSMSVLLRIQWNNRCEFKECTNKTALKVRN